MNNEIFVDWVTASQFYPQGGLPVLSGGLIVQYDSQGLPRFERNQPASFTGSFDSRIRVGCDGYRVSISGNVGRFSRKNNLFNHGWEQTKLAINRILADIGFPAFTPSIGQPTDKEYQRGAVVSRLDITCNYATGSELLARAIITFLTSKSFARMKKGNSGNESVWWANTRHMLKAYIKAPEMLAHGCEIDDRDYQFALLQGILRVELELKKRYLSDEKMNDWDDITQDKLEALFKESTAIFKGLDCTHDVFHLATVPQSSRVHASAWLAGQDLKGLLSNGSFYRHAKVLRDYGIDITQVRNVTKLQIKPRLIDMTPLVAPDWYQEENHYNGLRLVA